ncbi:MAG: SUMF1/EgtB/PvdO family nonheme iron enzyme, partial [Myxococcota bacterium]|nr:SUMF1/EgtB/PvdO family nonheme iron enzyme [Myxococcota bacterium]
MNKSYFIMSLVIVITGCLKSEPTVQVTSGLSCEETSDCPANFICLESVCFDLAQCGDGVIQGWEACDDGSNNSDEWSLTPHCNANCTKLAGHCGDGFLQIEETCDMGEGVNSNDYAGTSQICDLSCQGYAPYCGDGDITDGEVCDDGNNDDGDRCAADCSANQTVCGDGIVEGDEVCDDGFDINSDNYSVAPHCNAACTGFAPFCGDGFQDANEDCDTGDLNTSEYSEFGICNQYCDALAPHCGDGEVTHDEVCDDRDENSDVYSIGDGCNSTCTGRRPHCGDGIEQHASPADGSSALTISGAAEVCDDGNTQDDGNGCSETCTRIGLCGDGIVQYYFEDCDDSNDVTESCAYGDQSCVVCVGLGYIDADNAENSAPAGCQFRERVGAFCGDGIVQQEGLEGADVGGTRFTGEPTDRIDTGAWEGCDPDDDGAPIACSTLSPSLGSGIAICKSDCVGYDLSNCENQEQVYVPNGPFMMGCNEELDGDCGCRDTTDYTCVEGSINDEEAYHEVLVSQFLIDKHEARVSEYLECKDFGSLSWCGAPTNNSDDYDDYANLPRSGSRGNHPMNFLTYQSASEFCAFNNKRLPTEAEWEKAARGTDGRVFPWGEGLATCERAWVNDWYNTSCDDDGQGCTTGDDLTLMEIDLGCGQGRTTNVTNKSAFASPYGAVNMVGNVSEWVADCYGANYYQSETMSYQNPKNVDECDSGDYGVLRGGSFSDKSRNLRTSYRRKHGWNQNGYKGFGVRCVQDIIPTEGAVCGSELNLGTLAVGAVIATTGGATNNWGENLSADQTYRWSPAVAGNYTFTLEAEAGSDLDPKLRIVNSSTCEEIHNEDDGELTRQVGLGTWVLVADGQGGSSGAFALSVSLCKAYQDLGVALGSNLDGDGTTVPESGAVDNYGDNESHRDRAYVWRAPATSYYQFDTDGSAFNTRLRLLDSECTQLAVNT